jgi:hypothetical protein
MIVVDVCEEYTPDQFLLVAGLKGELNSSVGGLNVSNSSVRRCECLCLLGPGPSNIGKE